MLTFLKYANVSIITKFTSWLVVSECKESNPTCN